MSVELDELEREVERTRQGLAETAQALREKLAPRNLRREVLNSPTARKAADAAKTIGPVAAVALAILIVRARQQKARRGRVAHAGAHRSSIARRPAFR